MGTVVVLPWRVEERALRRVVIVVASVVLPCFVSGLKGDGKVEREST